MQKNEIGANEVEREVSSVHLLKCDAPEDRGEVRQIPVLMQNEVKALILTDRKVICHENCHQEES